MIVLREAVDDCLPQGLVLWGCQTDALLADVVKDSYHSNVKGIRFFTPHFVATVYRILNWPT